MGFIDDLMRKIESHFGDSRPRSKGQEALERGEHSIFGPPPIAQRPPHQAREGPPGESIVPAPRSEPERRVLAPAATRSFDTRVDPLRAMPPVARKAPEPADVSRSLSPISLFAAGHQDQGPIRPDGTRKDVGFLGVLQLRGGGVATEYSVPLFERGKPGERGYERGPDIPTLVPTLTREEIDMMANDIIPNRKRIPRSIIQKAIRHAEERMGQGLSPFFSSSGQAPEPADVSRSLSPISMLKGFTIKDPGIGGPTPAQVKRLSTQLAPAFQLIRSISKNERLGGLTLTEAQRDVHPVTGAPDRNLHRIGMAFDLSTRGMTDAQIDKVANRLRGIGYQVVTRTHGTAPHIHVELDTPKTKTELREFLAKNP